MNTFKTTLLAALLLFTVNAALAQDKYEYAVVAFNPWVKNLTISINGIEHKKIEVAKDEIKNHLDANPALKEVNKMINEGWELFNSDSNPIGDIGISYVFFLRKKVS